MTAVALGPHTARARPALRDRGAVALIALAGAAGYWLFPDNLSFLTRVISVALLVLSLDLVVGYCGIASLGQAALYGAGAYAAGIACLAGITDQLPAWGSLFTRQLPDAR